MSAGLADSLPRPFVHRLDRMRVGRLVSVAMAQLPLPRSLPKLFALQQSRAALLSAMPVARPDEEIVSRLDFEQGLTGEAAGARLQEIVQALARDLETLRGMPRDAAVLAAAQRAAQVPALLARARITAAPLPCLTGFSTAVWLPDTVEEREERIWQALHRQADEGLALLVACRRQLNQWSQRTGPLQKGGRGLDVMHLLAGLQQMTRSMLATALGVTNRGAEQAAAPLIRADVAHWRLDGRDKQLCIGPGPTAILNKPGVTDSEDPAFRAAAQATDAALADLERLLDNSLAITSGARER